MFGLSYEDIYASCFCYAMVLTQLPKAAEQLVENAFKEYTKRTSNFVKPLSIYLYIAKNAAKFVLQEGVHPAGVTSRSGYPAMFGLSNAHMSFDFESSNEPFLLQDIVAIMNYTPTESMLSEFEQKKLILAKMWMGKFGTDTKLSIILREHLLKTSEYSNEEIIKLISLTISRPVEDVEKIIAIFNSNWAMYTENEIIDLWGIFIVVTNVLSPIS